MDANESAFRRAEQAWLAAPVDLCRECGEETCGDVLCEECAPDDDAE